MVLKVTPEGLVITFVKQSKKISGDYRMDKDYPDHSDISLYCLNQYDQIILSINHLTVNSVIEELQKLRHPDIFASKKLIAYRFQEEHSIDFNFGKIGPVAYIILLRINHRLTGMPVFEMEARVSNYLKEQKESNDVKWAIARTFARKELLLFLSAEHILPCERIVAQLEQLSISPTLKTSAFDIIATWPCTRDKCKNQEDFFSLDREQPNTFSGLKVVGVCSREEYPRHICSFALNEEIFSDLRQPDGRPSSRPQVGSHGERQIGWSNKTGRNILGDVKRLRNECVNSSCSVKIIRNIPHLPEDYTYLFPEDLSLRLLSNTSPPLSNLPKLDPIKKVAGSKFIGDHLERIRNFIIQTIYNPFTLDDFSDLIPMLSEIDFVSKEYETISALGAGEKCGVEILDRLSKKQQNEIWNLTREDGRNLARHLDHAIKERSRENLLTTTFENNYTPLSATGFSRISKAAKYSFEKSLNFFGEKWRTLCTMGTDPVYRSHFLLHTVNSPLTATLEPYWHFGLGHELGHIIWDKKRLTDHPSLGGFGATLKDKVSSPEDQKVLTECFCDVLCLEYTFGLELEVFLPAWTRYFIDHIEMDTQQEFLAQLAGHPKIEEEGSKVQQYFLRLLIAIGFGLKRQGIAKDKLWKESINIIHSVIRKFIIQPEYRISLVVQEFITCANYFKRKVNNSVEIEKNTERAATYNEMNNLFERSISLLIELSDEIRPQAADGLSNEVENVSREIRSGNIVETPCLYPIAVLRKLGENSSFMANVAAINSLAYWAEIDPEPI